MKFLPTVRQHERGFSLIEIMTAVSLLALIIVGLLAMFYQVQRAFRAGVAQVDVMEGGRSTMIALARDIQEATPSRVPGVTNLMIVPARNTSAWGTSSGQDFPSGIGTNQNRLVDFYYLTEVNGQWSAVVYRVGASDTGVGTVYRGVWPVVYTNSPLEQELEIYKTTELVQRYALQDDVNNRTNFHRVMDGVIHFSADAYDRAGAFETYAELKGGGYVFGDFYMPRPDSAPTTGPVATTNILPAALEFEIRVLEPATVAKFRARLDDPVRAKAYLAKRIGQTHTFRQRVPLRAASAVQSAAN